MSDHLVRVEALQALKRHRQWSDADLARATGRSQQQVRTWFLPVGQKEARSIGERLARGIEDKLGLPRYTLDQRINTADITAGETRAPGTYPNSEGVTAAPIWVTNSPPRLVRVVAWEALRVSESPRTTQGMAGPTLETFSVVSERARFIEARDDSMHPTIQAGDHALIDPAVHPVAGDTVLLADATGEMFLRLYRPRTSTAFEAVAANVNYPPLHSTTDQLTVVGVMVEHRRYRKAPT